MLGVSEHGLFAGALAFYALAAGYGLFLWRRGFSRDDSWCHGLLAMGLVPHTWALLERGWSLQRCPVTNLFEVVMLLSWVTAAGTVVAGLWPRLRLLSAFVAPWLVVAGVFGIQPRLDEPGPHRDLAHGLLSLHVGSIILAYGLFGVAAAAGMMYLLQEHNLKFEKVRAVMSRLPSMERLEKVVTQLLVAGLASLTVGLALSVWLKHDGTAAGIDPKVVWSLLVWAAYAALLVLRFRFGRRNHWVAWGSVGSFAFILLTFWGTNLLSPLHN